MFARNQSLTATGRLHALFTALSPTTCLSSCSNIYIPGMHVLVVHARNSMCSGRCFADVRPSNGRSRMEDDIVTQASLSWFF